MQARLTQNVFSVFWAEDKSILYTILNTRNTKSISVYYSEHWAEDKNYLKVVADRISTTDTTSQSVF